MVELLIAVLLAALIIVPYDVWLRKRIKQKPPKEYCWEEYGYDFETGKFFRRTIPPGKQDVTGANHANSIGENPHARPGRRICS